MVQKNREKAKLILEDGSIFDGFLFGYEKAVSGEVVFNTGMMGYVESLTDPSYKGQILVFTYPLIGNYGVPEKSVDNLGLLKNFESEKIHVNGVIVAEYSEEYSHWSAKKSLEEWLIEEKVVGVTGIDTRMLTKKIREKGVMMGKIVTENQDTEIEKKVSSEVVKEVCTKKVLKYGNFKDNILIIDCGVKLNIIRNILKRKMNAIVIPYNLNPLEIEEEYLGVLISNGPGDPKDVKETIENIKRVIEKEIPIFGICLGNQILALATGADTYKLKYGHRSQNQPVKMLDNGKCFITSQNHGYAVNPNTLSKDWRELFVNINDNTNEGIIHKNKPFFSVQFHPEASPGPTDTEFLFDMFLDWCKYGRK